MHALLQFNFHGYDSEIKDGVPQGSSLGSVVLSLYRCIIVYCNGLNLTSSNAQTKVKQIKRQDPSVETILVVKKFTALFDKNHITQT